MPIGTLYVDVTKQVFVPVQTLLGLMHVVPTRELLKLPKGGFEVRLNPNLSGLSTPVKYYDLIRKDSDNSVGFGFLGPGATEVLDFGLIYRYSRRVDKVPVMVYRSKNFCVYHATNSATIITLPSTLPAIEDLLLAI